MCRILNADPQTLRCNLSRKVDELTVQHDANSSADLPAGFREIYNERAGGHRTLRIYRSQSPRHGVDRPC